MQKKSSVTPLNIGFWGQGIHFCGYFCDLTPKKQNRGQNYPFWGQNWVKIDFFEDHFAHYPDYP